MRQIADPSVAAMRCPSASRSRIAAPGRDRACASLPKTTSPNR